MLPRVGRVLILGPTVLGVVLMAQERPRFAAGTQMVEVYATVTDSSGELLTTLTREDFEVREDGVRQAVSAFVSGDFPLTVALGLDRSWSMAGIGLRLAKAASTAFLRDLRPQDRSMVLAIGSTAEVIAPLEVDRLGQVAAIEALDPWGTTALQDAIVAALDRLDGEPGRQALIIFSDGVDRFSTVTTGEVLARARRSQVLVYPITIGKTRPALLAELAALTGGRSYLLRDASQLQPTLAGIARELRYQYLLGYVPVRPVGTGGSEWRSIAVTVRQTSSGVRVRARDGYFTE